jgi:NitT/TauT family transport system ATP-binding protein
MGAQDPVSTTVLDLHVGALSLDGKPVLGEIDMTIQKSATVALVGPSGIGKTSLLRIIAGLESGYVGTCRATGPVAMVFQEPTLLPWRSALENICLAADVSVERAQAALRDVGLGDRSHSLPGQMSLGQQRRLSLARAFAAKPTLLLMDEPFVSLDPELVEEMMALFKTLRSRYQVTTILVTHARHEAERLANRIVTLKGSPARIDGDVQNTGAYFQSSASGVTSSRS